MIVLHSMVIAVSNVPKTTSTSSLKTEYQESCPKCAVVLFCTTPTALSSLSWWKKLGVEKELSSCAYDPFGRFILFGGGKNK